MAKKPKKGKKSEQSRLASKALGPAADEFGHEVAPLGKRSGALANRVGHLMLDSVESWVEQREKLRKNVSDDLAKKLENVKPEDVVAPTPRIAGPALQGLSMAADEDQIREMFLNLIAADMTSAEKSNAHPAFAEIIKEMTVEDAKVLAILKREHQVIFYARVAGDGGHWKDLGTQFSFVIEGLLIEKLDRSISNLDRLGLIELRMNEWPVLKDLDAIEAKVKETFDKVELALKEPSVLARLGLGTNINVQIRKAGIFLTPFGISFARICIK